MIGRKVKAIRIRFRLTIVAKSMHSDVWMGTTSGKSLETRNESTTKSIMFSRYQHLCANYILNHAGML
jgi:hypothetical protein